MTILPVKKKREKDAAQKSSSASGSSGDQNRGHHHHHHHQSIVGSSSGAKRNHQRIPQQQDDGPYSKRWAIPQSSGISPRPAHQSTSSATSSTYSNPHAPPPPPPPPSTVPPTAAAPSATVTQNNSENVDLAAKCRRNGSSNGNGDYNSDDEYREEHQRDDALEADFADRLARRGLIIKEMEGDGACMFRAIAEQIYGDQEMHGQIRQLCMDYMLRNRDHFREFITENYENYIERKRADHVHGNHVELQAISEMFARPVEVYQYSDEPINVLMPRPDAEVIPPVGGPNEVGGANAEGGGASAAPPQQNPPLRLSYHRAVHYNAILDPKVPTIGVGLGLPGMVPGAADKDLMTKAMAKSELEHIEETMLQDKMDLTDYQRTQADLEDQIARESLLTYLKDLESKSGPSTSQQSTSSGGGGEVGGASTGGGSLYEEMLAAQSLEWDTYAYSDDVPIAEALLVSQQDFLAKNSQQPGPSGSK
ncbi:hypothetical protein L3Y34_005454 [Caenorhabditis briggsae]|uniref:ubiquitinyl hydrolase 1 n=1 Tax=Caenorhabditis briggsae TaxID=6238 RepID=A0AAE9AJG6_CAEBR|nr:hypothetical protein L3Y34_005454 [Caenorhabditis briggsae]